MAPDQELADYLGTVRQVKTHNILTYFKPVTPRKPQANVSGKFSFFDLPFVVRRRIYSHAGLEEGMATYLNYKDTHPLEGLILDGKEEHEMYEDGKEEDCCPAMYNFWNSSPVNQVESISNNSQQLSRFISDTIPHIYIRLNYRCACGRPQSDSDDPESTSPTYCICNPLPGHLLHVSPRLDRELKALFLSTSHFRVDQSYPAGLSILRSLDPEAWAWMVSLRLQLSFGKPKQMIRWYGQYPSTVFSTWKQKNRNTERPSDYFSRQERAKLLEWEQLCVGMAKYLTPYRLSLHISAQVSNIDVAREIVAPLVRVGKLKQCSLELSLPSRTFPWQALPGPFIRPMSSPKWNLLQLAQQTVLAATTKRRDDPLRPFPLLDLPLEIQMHILGFTDLVTSYDLAWNSGKYDEGGARFFELRKLEDFVVLCYPYYGFQCCGNCTQNCIPTKTYGRGHECCCWVNGNAASSSCTCWRMPPLFCVSQDIQQKSMSIFYSRNHFVVLPSHDCQPRPDEMLHFLTSIPHLGRYLLRSITWICPKNPYQMRGFGPLESDSDLYADWTEFVDICGRDLNLSKLSLIIDMTLHVNMYEDSGIDEFDGIEEVFESAEYSQISKLVAALTNYKGWGKFAIHLGFPTFDYEDESGNEAYEDIEKYFERLVMGEGYDSWKNGKYDRRHISNGYDCAPICGDGCDEEPL